MYSVFIIIEGIPIRSKAVVVFIVLTLLSPAVEAARAGTSDCCGSAASSAPMPADLFGGAVVPVDADSGNPCGGESQECCSCESGQPLFAALSSGSGATVLAVAFLGPSHPSDPSAAVSSEIFRPPLS